MALPGGVSIKSLVGLMFLFIGLLLHTIGLATPEWSVYEFTSTEHFGLWERCTEDGCYRIPSALKSAKLEVCEAFSLLGLFAAVGALTLGLLHFLMAILGKSQKKLIQGVILGTSVLTLLLILICVITWGAGIHETQLMSIGYSFILSLLGGFFSTAGGVLTYLDAGQVVG